MNPAGGSVGPPAPQYPGPGVHRVNHPAPQYSGPGLHVANPPVPQYPGPAANGGYPPPPPYPGLRTRAQNGSPPAGGGAHQPATDNNHRGDAHPAVVQKESRKGKWAMFLVGNLIFIAGIVFEIEKFDVCFDENLGDDDDTPEENAELLDEWMMSLLIFGLWIDVFSAILLSVVYQSPLDIKSVHKIPPGDMRNLKMTAIVNFLAPFSWGVLYFWGGLMSNAYGDNSSCGDGVESSALGEYLSISGGLMLIFSVGMLWLSVRKATAACCCSSPTSLSVQSTKNSCLRVGSLTWCGSYRERSYHIDQGP